MRKPLALTAAFVPLAAALVWFGWPRTEVVARFALDPSTEIVVEFRDTWRLSPDRFAFGDRSGLLIGRIFAARSTREMREEIRLFPLAKPFPDEGFALEASGDARVLKDVRWGMTWTFVRDSKRPSGWALAPDR